MNEPQTRDPMVAALLRERAGYVGRKGKEDRVAAVDEQLELRGYSPDGEQVAADPDAEANAESRSTPPKGRQTRGTDKA
ncbi:hypothetical protein [Streptomyces acidiscabies]|uniref:hypothetical protein n=1 Tax=Streptomyces acidiscabies TaxID=42234 RepID=UPI0009528208|nr:hypothetical protein [Streptomyces acidiscabies]